MFALPSFNRLPLCPECAVGACRIVIVGHLMVLLARRGHIPALESCKAETPGSLVRAISSRTMKPADPRDNGSEHTPKQTDYGWVPTLTLDDSPLPRIGHLKQQNTTCCRLVPAGTGILSAEPYFGLAWLPQSHTTDSRGRDYFHFDADAISAILLPTPLIGGMIGVFLAWPLVTTSLRQSRKH